MTSIAHADPMQPARGSATVEITLLIPALLITLGLLIIGGRIWFARTTVNEAANSAARAASLARSAAEAATLGRTAANQSLSTNGLRCTLDGRRGQHRRLRRTRRHSSHDHHEHQLPRPVRRPSAAAHPRRRRPDRQRRLGPRHLPEPMIMHSGERTARATRSRDERGLSVTPFVAVIFAALIMTVGLVVDGGQKVAAASRAETAAAGAGRAAGNAAATQELGARDPVAAATLAARTYLAGQPGVTG